MATKKQSPQPPPPSPQGVGLFPGGLGAHHPALLKAREVKASLDAAMAEHEPLDEFLEALERGDYEPTDPLAYEVAQALAGNPDATRAVLEHFSNAVLCSATPHPAAQAFAALSMRRMLDGESPRAVLGLNRGRAGRPQRNVADDIEIYLEVRRLVREGCSFERAVATIAGRKHWSDSKVREIYSRVHPLFKDDPRTR